jgi:hypothetical protein
MSTKMLSHSNTHIDLGTQNVGKPLETICTIYLVYVTYKP